jgi:SAM-dependent methyltransferase
MAVLGLADLDRANAECWYELCGSHLARALGVSDRFPRSRKIFRVSLDFYPYLLERVNLPRMAGRAVLEVALGHGTLGQKIVEAGAHYLGLDVSAGPERMMRHRLRLRRLSGVCVRGSILKLPLTGACVDDVVSSGWFHHTGNLTATHRRDLSDPAARWFRCHHALQPVLSSTVSSVAGVDLVGRPPRCRPPGPPDAHRRRATPCL